MEAQIIEVVKAALLVAGGGLGAKLIEYLVARYSGRMTVTMNDREELKKFIEDQRRRLAEMELRIDNLYRENSDLRVKLAMFQQEQQDWEGERKQLLARIQELENKVKTLELDNKNREFTVGTP